MKYFHELQIDEPTLPGSEFEELCRLKPECRKPNGFRYEIPTDNAEGDEFLRYALGLLKHHGIPHRDQSDGTHYGYSILRWYDEADVVAAEFLLLDWQRKLQKGVKPERDEHGRLIVLARNVTSSLKFASTYPDNSIFVSDKVRRILEGGGLVGLQFGETTIQGGSGSVSGEPAWELQSAITLPKIANTHQLVHRGKTEAEPFTGDYSRQVLINDPPFVGGEPHYRRSDLAAVGSFDIANMREKFINEHALIISQRFYQHCIRNKISLALDKLSLGVRPVRIDPD